MLEDNLLINEIKNKVLCDKRISNLNDQELKFYVNKLLIKDYWPSRKFNLNEIIALSKQVFYRIRGLGILENLLVDENISEIMVNDINHIFIEKMGKLYKSDFIIESLDEYNRIIQKIVSKAGREVNQSKPIVDARLEDGSRVNIVLPPISKGQPVLTIRKFPKKHIDMNFLIKTQTLNMRAANFISSLVKSKYNILISGGTSSGKTTFLNALTEYIDDCERIITIEDSRELQIINKENLISLETRNSNNSNKGQVDIRSLIKNALRMRPDRIIVGEVRSSEAIDMLTALNTGHEGGLTTAHANSCEDMISRLETMVLRSDSNIPLEAAQRMIGSSIEIIMQLSKVEGAKRRLIEISELNYIDGKIAINRLYTYDVGKDSLIEVGNGLIKHEKLKNFTKKL